MLAIRDDGAMAGKAVNAENDGPVVPALPILPVLPLRPGLPVASTGPIARIARLPRRYDRIEIPTWNVWKN